MSNTRNPKTQEPPLKRRRSKKNPSNTDADEDVEALQKALGLLEPLIDFHKPVECAAEDDLRIYWDVRIIRGQDSAFAHSQGSSSLPGALTSKMKAQAPAMIQQEIQEKISRPLTAKLQTVAEQLTMEERDARGGEPFCDAGAAEGLA